MPCSVLELSTNRVAGTRLQALIHAWQAHYFVHIAKPLAGVGQHEKCCHSWCCAPGIVFGEFRRCFARLKRVFLLLDLVLVPGVFDAAGAVLWMPQAHFSWQLQFILETSG